jgi:hypothetical protein
LGNHVGEGVITMQTTLRDRSIKRVRAEQIAFGHYVLTEERAPQSRDSEDPEVRTCTHCGEHVPFRIDPLGSWAECTVCGHLN